VTDARYRNFGHYIGEGWSAEPKESFTALAAHIDAHGPQPSGEHLDIGCATGELIGFLSSRYPGLHSTGVDVFDELLLRAPICRLRSSCRHRPWRCRRHSPDDSTW
jgi:trans-aconitate methyltransferase